MTSHTRGCFVFFCFFFGGICEQNSPRGEIWSKPRLGRRKQEVTLVLPWWFLADPPEWGWRREGKISSDEWAHRWFPADGREEQSVFGSTAVFLLMKNLFLCCCQATVNSCKSKIWLKGTLQLSCNCFWCCWVASSLIFLHYATYLSHDSFLKTNMAFQKPTKLFQQPQRLLWKFFQNP